MGWKAAEEEGLIEGWRGDESEAPKPGCNTVALIYGAVLPTSCHLHLNISPSNQLRLGGNVSKWARLLLITFKWM